MDEQPNLQSFVNEISSFSDETSGPEKAAAPAGELHAIGEVVEIDKTDTIFLNPKRKETEDYITGRFG